MTAEEPNPPTCPRCGGALPPGVGVCSHCQAVAGTMADGEAPAASSGGSATLPDKPKGSNAGGLDGPDGGGKPKWVGAYRILEQLGEGGFGIVYRAEQREPLRREVALKVIKPGMDSRQIVQRFEGERRTLALMEHPNIAGVLDAGTTDTGLPYFVMELVRGKPITEYCDEKRLTIRQRLELFIPVCLAVHHAHQKAILHRDLKPSNILVAEVDGQPVPKVIDFGIAKALGSEAGGVTLDDRLFRTLDGSVIGTPQYMSPEQAGAAPDLDTRSDIYTLGVILYEMLTGNPPLSRETLRQAAFNEVLRLVREGEIKRPSSALVPVTQATDTVATHRSTTARRLGETVKGELDWIVLRAVEKERSRRYDSAKSLSDDIQRFLHDEPVQASPPSRLYRLRKFSRRHRLAIFASALAVTGLVVGSVIALWQAKVANAAKERAITQQQRAEANERRSVSVTTFLMRDIIGQAAGIGQLERGDPPDPNITLSVALERAEKSVGETLGDAPEEQAVVRTMLGQALNRLSLSERAQAQLEPAVELLSGLYGPTGEWTLEAREHLAEALSRSDPQQALLVCEALENDLLRGPNGDDTKFRRVESRRAGILASLGRIEESIALYDRVLTRQQGDDANSVWQRLATMHNLALILADSPQPAHKRRARSLMEEALRLREQRRQADHPYAGALLNNLADICMAEDPEHALSLRVRALAILRKAYPATHRDVLICLERLAKNCLLMKRKTPDFTPPDILRQVLEELRQLPKGDAATSSARISYGKACAALGQGSTLDAGWLALLLDEIRDSQINRAEAIADLIRIGEALMKQGDCDSARRILRRALDATRDPAFGSQGEEAFALSVMGRNERRDGNAAEAVKLLQQALQLREAAGEGNLAKFYVTLHNLALAQSEAGETAAAVQNFERALAGLRKHEPPGGSNLATTLKNLAALYETVGRTADAAALRQELGSAKPSGDQ